MPKRRTTSSAKLSARDEEPPLSAAWVREIERRVKDSLDPIRYIVVSVLLPGPPKRWELFYNITDDVWAMEIEGATLFKRKSMAHAVARRLGGRYEVNEVRLGKNRKVIRPRTAAKKRSR